MLLFNNINKFSSCTPGGLFQLVCVWYCFPKCRKLLWKWRIRAGRSWFRDGRSLRITWRKNIMKFEHKIELMISHHSFEETQSWCKSYVEGLPGQVLSHYKWEVLPNALVFWIENTNHPEKFDQKQPRCFISEVSNFLYKMWKS